MLKSEDYRALGGPQRAAIFMMALGEEQCTRLFALMHEDEIKDIYDAEKQLTRALPKLIKAATAAGVTDPAVSTAHFQALS